MTTAYVIQLDITRDLDLEEDDKLLINNMMQNLKGHFKKSRTIPFLFPAGNG
jgi:hypothetical protein